MNANLIFSKIFEILKFLILFLIYFLMNFSVSIFNPKSLKKKFNTLLLNLI